MYDPRTEPEFDTPMPSLFHCHHGAVGEPYEERKLNAVCVQSVTSFQEDRTIYLICCIILVIQCTVCMSLGGL